MNILKEYGNEIDLQDVLEQLTVALLNLGVKNPKLTIVVPKEVLDRYTASFPLKNVTNPERFALTNPIITTSSGGLIKIYSEAEVSIVTKDSAERPE